MARRHGRSRPAARADAEARRGQRQPDEGRKPRPHLLQAAAAHERHGQNALQHLHSPHGGGNARAPRGADAVVRRGDHRAHDHLDRRLLRPQRKHRLLPVLGGQLDHRGLHVRLVGQFHASVSGRYTALAGGPAQRRAARLLRHRVRLVRAHRARSCSQNGPFRRLRHRARGLSGHNAHFHHRLLHRGFRPLAAVQPSCAAHRDVCRRLRRLDCRRHQGLAHRAALQGAQARPAPHPAHA